MPHDVDNHQHKTYTGGMFVRTAKKNIDHVSVRIVKSVRKGSKIKQQTICCVGHTHKNNIEKIRKKRKDGIINIADLVSNRGVKKYLKMDKKGSKHAVLNEQKIKAESLWDGISAVITNKDKTDAKEICNQYKDLWQIEAAFRLNKHDLRMRPVYHWTPKRIQAHILICFIAYSLVCFVRYSLRQANINLSFEKIKEELLAVQQTVIHDTRSKKTFVLPSPSNKSQKAIYKCFNKTISQTVRFLPTPS